MIMQDSSKHIWMMVSGFITGGGAMRLWNYVSHALPPLPSKAGWMQTFAYNVVSGTSGHDPTNNIKPLDNQTISGSK